MGVAAICNTYTDLLNSWTESDKQANVRHQACLDGAKVAENGYRILCLGGGNGIPENTCEAKVRHYASKLAEHIYQETKLPPVKDPVVLGEYSPILSRCHSLYEYGKGARADNWREWSDDIQAQETKFSETGAYEQIKLAEITKTHPREGDALSTLYKDYGTNLFKRSSDKQKYDAKESGAEAKCSAILREENFKTAKTVGVVVIAIAVIAIAAKVYCDKQKEKEKQKTQVALKA
ncbi:MAG: hypothetical protein K2Y01_08790 [Rhabdochlamydiaceae bacterium]|nr:hypothetical protein [Rhabdochlamydiaceae bacterium]